MKTPATTVLEKAKIAYTVHTYEHENERSKELGGFGNETAVMLGVDPARLFKTLVTQVGTELVVGVVPVSGKVDLKALAKAVGGKKAEMADPAVAQRATGYVPGGISPLGQKTRLTTVVDESALAWETILVSGGRRGMQLELAPADLVRVTEAVVAAIGTA